jgi:hypothetical protein
MYIYIPMIQRDYAQGRPQPNIRLIRKRFLDAIFDAITNGDKLELDFVYGQKDLDQSLSDAPDTVDIFTPLDGQQRLTTLFLLHWYAASIEGHINRGEGEDLSEATKLLDRFRYKTRYSAETFCSKLVRHKIELKTSEKVSKHIQDQRWFFYGWETDPTIESMLTMIDEIHTRYEDHDLENLWPDLISTNSPIQYHVLEMNEYGLKDDLYIKMNARGKPLTGFEHFKSEFGLHLEKTFGDEVRKSFYKKSDGIWSDLFWEMYKHETGDIDRAKLADDAFMRVFSYICHILNHQSETKVTFDDDVASYFEVFKTSSQWEFFCDTLDGFANTFKEDKKYFEGYFYTEIEAFDLHKTRLFFDKADINLFKRCADRFDPTQRSNPFSFGEQLILFTVILNINRSPVNFPQRVRTVRNLVSNSEDRLRRENMGSLLTDVERIIISGSQLNQKESFFTNSQIEDEARKKAYLNKHPAHVKFINFLEDHTLLAGCVALFDLNEELEWVSHAFHELFNSEVLLDDIAKALMSIAPDYSQKMGNTVRYGNSNDRDWRNIFTPSLRWEGFSNTKSAVRTLLEYLKQHPDESVQSIKNTHISSFDTDPQKPKGWSFYFIKYTEFHENNNGHFSFREGENQFSRQMLRKYTRRGFHWDPFLKTIHNRFPNITILEDYGNPLLVSSEGYSFNLTCGAKGYHITPISDRGPLVTLFELLPEPLRPSEEMILSVGQIGQGEDLRDRIELASDFINEFKSISQGE